MTFKSSLNFCFVRLSREDDDKIEFENKDHKSLMKQNGITNRVKIVLNPLILEDQANSNHEKEDCPILSVELPLFEAEKAETSKLNNISQFDASLANIPDITSTVEENKVEVKKPNIYTNFKMGKCKKIDDRFIYFLTNDHIIKF